MSKIERAASGVHRGSVRGLRQLVKGAKATKRATARSQAKTVNLYGTAMGGVVREKYGSARAVAAGGVAKAGAAAAMGSAMGRIGNVVQSIAETGAAAQSEAANFAFANALAARNAVSAETLAGLTGQMYQTALQYQLEWDMWKRQQDYAEKQAKETEKPAINYLNGIAPGIAADAGDLIRANVTGAEGAQLADIEPGVLSAEWAAANGYGPSEQAIMAATLRNMKSGMNAGPSMTTALRTLYSDMPGWNRWGDSLMRGLAAGAEAETYARYAPTLADDNDAATVAGVLGERAVAEIPSLREQFGLGPVVPEKPEQGETAPLEPKAQVGENRWRDAIGNFWTKEDGKWVRV
jgi:hypothetical protein